MSEQQLVLLPVFSAVGLGLKRIAETGRGADNVGKDKEQPLLLSSSRKFRGRALLSNGAPIGHGP